MKFEGVFTAIITPFQNNGKDIDYGAYRELIDRQVEAGIVGVVPCGTTGESPTLNHKEHEELIRKTVEFVNKRCAVIAGTGSNSTAEAIELTKSACSDGVDAVMLVNPYYNKPTQEGLFQHFKTIAEVADKPVVLYNIQGRTGVNVSVETLQRLVEIDNIKCVKEASGDLGQMSRVKYYCGDKIAMLSGDDNIIPAVMGIGGNGVISVISNLYPRRMVRMMNHYLKGDFAAGNEVFYGLIEMMNAMFWETNPIPVKAAAEIMKLSSGDLRLPMVALNGEKMAQLKAIVEKTGADN